MNIHSSAIKKYLFEIMRERYEKNERIIDRLVGSISNQEDYEALGSMIVDIYEIGFLKAVNEYKDQLAKMGLKVNVVAEEKPKANSKIFNQSEKSG